MGRKIKSVSLLAIFALVFSVIPPPQKTYAALDTEPTRKVEIVIQSSKVDASLTDFPVLLTEDTVPSEACDADGSSPAQDGGGDIRFTSDENGNDRLALEIVDFSTDNDPANCTIEMYVKVPSVSSTSNTSIWMWYNTSGTDTQPSASSTYGSENVWDSNFKGVWHLGESTSTRSDSTSNSNDLADNNTVGSTTGKWGTAADFERQNSEFLDISDASQSGLDITSDMSGSAWIRFEDHSADDYHFFTKYESTGLEYSYHFQLNYTGGQDKLRFTNYSSGNPSSALVPWEPTNEVWYNIGFSFDSSEGEVRFYVDGIQQGSTQTGLNTGIDDKAGNFEIGSIDGGVDFMDGEIQSLKVSSVVRSDAWFKAEYENQNSPNTFAVEQAPQNGSTAPAESSVVKGADESVTTSTTLQNDNHFEFELNPNTEYILTSGIFATSASGNPDIQIGFTIPDGATMDIGYLAQGGSNRRAELLETPGSESSRIPIPGNNTTIIQAFGSIVTGATGGTLNFQWSQATSNATATTVKQGSFMSVAEATNE